MDISKFAQATALVALVAGCATTTKVPRERITASEAAVRTAEQMKSVAPATPAAEHHLRLAHEELAAAHREMRDGRHRRAEMLFIRARTDAELAQALALSTKAEAETKKTQTELEKVKSGSPAAAAVTTEPATGGVSVNVAPGTSVEIQSSRTTIKTKTKERKADGTAATPEIPDEEEHAENTPQHR